MGTEEDIVCFFMDYPNQLFDRNEIAEYINGNTQSITRACSKLAKIQKGKGFSVRMYGKMYRIKCVGNSSYSKNYRKGNKYGLMESNV